MKDMTEGPLFSHLWQYALPLLLANWLQLAYNACDSMIAGRFIGKEALAAEGIAAPVMNFTILAISGLCIGAGIYMSERYGARDMSSLRRAFAAVMKAGILTSLAAAAAGVILTPAILRLLSVPEDIFHITSVYLRICLTGMPLTFIYNALAAALKSVGDSKTPLRFLAVSSVLNIVLDLILLGIFGFGIAVSALTTIIAEAVSVFLTARYIHSHMRQLVPEDDEWKTDRVILKRVMNYGLPSALQQAVQPIGKIMIQSQVNLLGVSSIAAFNAVSRVDSFACIPEQGIAAAIATCIAQNRGAGKNERVRKGFAAGISMEIAYGLFIAVLTLLLGKYAVALFVKGAEQEVISQGTVYLSVMAFMYILPGLTNGFQGYCRGVGKIPVTIMCTFIQISLRTAGTYILAPKIGIAGIAAASGIGWTAMLIFEIPYVLHHMKTNYSSSGQE